MYYITGKQAAHIQTISEEWLWMKKTLVSQPFPIVSFYFSVWFKGIVKMLSRFIKDIFFIDIR